MIKSMTGFGSYEVTENNRKISVEMRSVNHRYLDINIKMPKSLLAFEAAIRTELKEYISRGKVDVFISYEDYNEGNTCVRYNRELAGEYMKYLDEMASDFGLENDVKLSRLSAFPDVLTLEEQDTDEEELWKELKGAVAGACERFCESREEEGIRLKEDLLGKLDGMLKEVDFITVRSPQIIADYRERLEEKVTELLGDRQIDESRLLTEVALMADKICTDEEVVRLRSHIEATREALEDGESVGRRLDFIVQEMNREANTILSKANDLEVSNCAINLKTEIEKVREQIQNIE